MIVVFNFKNILKMFIVVLIFVSKVTTWHSTLAEFYFEVSRKGLLKQFRRFYEGSNGKSKGLFTETICFEIMNF